MSRRLLLSAVVVIWVAESCDHFNKPFQKKAGNCGGGGKWSPEQGGNVKRCVGAKTEPDCLAACMGDDLCAAYDRADVPPGDAVECCLYREGSRADSTTGRSCMIGTCKDPSFGPGDPNTFSVLSDRATGAKIGTMFHFDCAAGAKAYGEDIRNDFNYRVKNQRNMKSGEATLYTSNNGGPAGNCHGKWAVASDSEDALSERDFVIGDVMLFTKPIPQASSDSGDVGDSCDSPGDCVAGICSEQPYHWNAANSLKTQTMRCTAGPEGATCNKEHSNCQSGCCVKGKCVKKNSQNWGQNCHESCQCYSAFPSCHTRRDYLNTYDVSVSKCFPAKDPVKAEHGAQCARAYHGQGMTLSCRQPTTWDVNAGHSGGTGLLKRITRADYTIPHQSHCSAYRSGSCRSPNTWAPLHKYFNEHCAGKRWCSLRVNHPTYGYQRCYTERRWRDWWDVKPKEEDGKMKPGEGFHHDEINLPRPWHMTLNVQFVCEADSDGHRFDVHQDWEELQRFRSNPNSVSFTDEIDYSRH